MCPESETSEFLRQAARDSAARRSRLLFLKAATMSLPTGQMGGSMPIFHPDLFRTSNVQKAPWLLPEERLQLALRMVPEPELQLPGSD